MKEIELTRGQMARVDDADYEALTEWSWFAHWDSKMRSYYAARTERQGNRWISMARQIMSAGPDDKVDHIDHDTLNNQRSNLRIVTHAQNMYNKKPQPNGLSAFKGVTWHKDHQKWNARITFNKEVRSLGDFVFEEDAARAYDAAALECFGEYAYLNFPQAASVACG